MLPFEVTKSLSCSMRKTFFHPVLPSPRQMYAVCICDRQWGWERGYCVLTAVALMFSSNRKGGFAFQLPESRCELLWLFDWQKQMSIMFISESLRRCQCHLTVSLNLCKGSGRNCQGCLSSISHTSWKSRLRCHSFLIHTEPKALWVDLVKDISEVKQQTIKLCLLTK